MLAGLADSYESLTVPNTTTVVSAAKHHKKHKKHVKKHKKHVKKRVVKKHVTKKYVTTSTDSDTSNSSNSGNDDVNYQAKPTTPSNTNPGVENNSATAGTTPQSNYPSLGDWFIANDKYLYDRYSGKGLFSDAQNDAASWNNSMDWTKYDNQYYEIGCIITHVNTQYNEPTDSALYGATADNYNKAIQIYNAGAAYIKSNQPDSNIHYDSDSGNWMPY